MKKGYAVIDDLHQVHAVYASEEIAKMVIKRLFTCKTWLDSELALCYVKMDSTNKVIEILEQINVF